MQEQIGTDTIKKWNRRNIIIFIFSIIVLVVAELYFHFIEFGIGHYLVWQNEGRERVGRSWAEAKNVTAAGTSLESYSQKVRQEEQRLRQINTLNELLQLLQSETRVTLPPEVFLRVYNSLPQALNPLFIPADELIEYRVNGELENVYVELGSNGLRTVFLSPGNKILLENTLDPQALDMLKTHGTSQVIDISNDDRFRARKFTLRRFQQLLDEISFETKTSFLNAMPALLEVANQNPRIAISNEIVDNFHEVAIANDNLRAVVYYIPADWINELIEVFEEQDFEQSDTEEFFL